MEVTAAAEVEASAATKGMQQLEQLFLAEAEAAGCYDLTDSDDDDSNDEMDLAALHDVDDTKVREYFQNYLKKVQAAEGKQAQAPGQHLEEKRGGARKQKSEGASKAHAVGVGRVGEQPGAAPEAAAAMGNGRSGSVGTSAASMSSGGPGRRVLPPSRKLPLNLDQIEQLELLWRAVQGAAVLANAAVEAAGPLMLQHGLREAVLAVEVVGGGLRALGAATMGVEVEEAMGEELVDKGAATQVRMGGDGRRVCRGGEGLGWGVGWGKGGSGVGVGVRGGAWEGGVLGKRMGGKGGQDKWVGLGHWAREGGVGKGGRGMGGGTNWMVAKKASIEC